MGLSCPLGITRFVPAKATFFGVIFCPYNKSFFDQVCSVKMAGYWPRSFFAFLWTSTLPRSIITQEKELGQYPVILAEQLKGHIQLWDRAGLDTSFLNNAYLSSHENSSSPTPRSKLRHLKNDLIYFPDITTMNMALESTITQSSLQKNALKASAPATDFTC